MDVVTLKRLAAMMREKNEPPVKTMTIPVYQKQAAIYAIIEAMEELATEMALELYSENMKKFEDELGISTFKKKD